MERLISDVKKFPAFIFIVGLAVLMASCGDDDDATDPDDDPYADGEAYTLSAVGDSGVSGTVDFQKNDDNSTTVIIELSGTSEGNNHPAHIHFNDVAEGGDIAVTLGEVNGGTGRSETIVTMFDDSTTVSYEELIAFDGHVNVHQSTDSIAVLIAQGDIGANSDL